MKPQLIMMLLITLCVLGTTASFYILTKAARPNNQYTIDLYQQYYILKDSKRTVDTIPFGKIPQLDSVFLKDNL